MPDRRGRRRQLRFTQSTAVSIGSPTWAPAIGPSCRGSSRATRAVRRAPSWPCATAAPTWCWHWTRTVPSVVARSPTSHVRRARRGNAGRPARQWPARRDLTVAAMPQALLGWELGGGLGHLARLRPVASRLLAAGWRVHLAAAQRGGAVTLFRELTQRWPGELTLGPHQARPQSLVRPSPTDTLPRTCLPCTATRTH